MKKGDTVKLSAEGLRIFNRTRRGAVKPEDRRGKIVNAGHDSPKPLPERCVRVWWDQCAGPETIAKDFVELA